jgi:hypothetical protein
MEKLIPLKGTHFRKTISLEYLKRGFIKQIVISHLFCLAANRFIFEMQMRNKILSAVILTML